MESTESKQILPSVQLVWFSLISLQISKMAAVFLVLILHSLACGTLSSVLSDGSQSATTCNTCCQCPAGLPGVPGVPGSNGLHGRDGLKGEAGMNGIAGNKGEAGAVGGRGQPGPQGPSGDRGERGDPGLRGLPGKVGPRGLEGSPGVDGRPGEGQPGPIGPKGNKGDSPQIRQSAFSVYKTSRQDGNAGDVLTFNIERTNLGSHFSMGTNKFTCQVPGTYVFMFSILQYRVQDPDPFIRLIKDGEKVAGTHVNDQSSNSFHHQMSNMAVLQLAAGNEVWLDFGHTGGVYSDGNLFTSFSGFLLYAS